MSENAKCTPCIQKKATDLIANKQTKWGETDREYLETLEESVLDKMLPEEVKPLETNKEEKKEEKKPEVPAIEALSAEDKAALAYGKRQLKERKDTMIVGIQDNTSKELWPDEVLATMDDVMLERVFNSVKANKKEEEAVVDYSLNGVRTNRVSADDEEPLYPVGIEITKK